MSASSSTGLRSLIFCLAHTLLVVTVVAAMLVGPPLAGLNVGVRPALAAEEESAGSAAIANSPPVSPLSNGKEEENPILANLKPGPEVTTDDKVSLSTGAASYAYPIAVPPGPGGMQPSLALVYNSEAKWGRLGYGWSIAGLGAISRSTRDGAPQYDSDDIFVWGGEDLILHTDGYYHTQHESYNRIQNVGGFGAGSYWVVTARNGVQYRYGYNPNSRIEAVGKSGAVRAWALDRVKDVYGNYMTITYDEDTSNGDYYPDTITYTYNAGLSKYHTVKFNWEPRTDVPPSYAEGALVKIDQRLLNVEVKADGVLQRKYVLDYATGSGGKSLLSEIKPCSDAAATNCLPPTTFDYQASGDFFAAQPNWPGSNNSGGYLSSYCGIPGFRQLCHNLVDINGDGLPDDVYHYEDNYSVRLGTGSGWSASLEDWGSGNGDYIAFSNQHLTKALMDMNGDGLPDEVVRNGDDYQVRLNTGSSFAPVDMWSGGGGSAIQEYHASSSNNPIWREMSRSLIDMNGDGLPDNVHRYKTSDYTVQLNTGSGFGAAQNWGSVGQQGKGVAYYSGSGAANIQHALIDMNGDGLPDDVYRISDIAYQVRLNTGSNFATVQYWSGGQDFDIERVRVKAGMNYDTLYTWHRLIDVNGDGLPDDVYRNAMFSGDYQVALNTGSSFAAPQVWRSEVQSIGVQCRTPHGVQHDLVDMNGDGLPDSVRRWNDEYQVALNDAGNVYLLTMVSVPTGGSIIYGYDRSTSFDNTDLSGDECLPFPKWVVTSVTLDDGFNSVATSYAYKGGLYDAADREFRGFREVTVSDAEGNYQVTTFLQDDVYRGLVSKNESRAADGSLMGKAEHTYASTNIGSDIVFPYLQKSDAYVYDGNDSYKQMRTEYTYDAYGNATKVSNMGDVGVTGDEVYAYTEYINDATNWMLGVPKHSYANKSDDATKVAESWNYYSNNYGDAGDYGSSVKYLRKTETAMVFGSRGNAANPTVELTYDQWGNVVSTKDPLGQTTITTAYDSVYRMFPVNSTNALGYTSYTYYYGVNEGGDTGCASCSGLFSQVKSVQGVNGKFVRSKYDEFGRIVASWGENFSEDYPATSYEYEPFWWNSYIDPDPGPPDPEGLVGWWAFDEGEGTEAADGSGNGNTGTLVSAPSWVEGKVGQALNFDDSNYDYVDIADSPSLGDFSDQISLAAWIWPDNFYPGWLGTNSPTIISKRDAYYLDVAGGRLTFSWGGLGWRHSPNTISTGKWTHVAATYDGMYVRLYEDGEEVYSAAVTGYGSTNSEKVGIGGYFPHHFEARRFLDGRVDEVAIYDRGLSEAEVQALMGKRPNFNPNQIVTHVREQDGQVETFDTYSYVDGLGRVVQTQTPSEEAGKMMVSGPVEYNSRGLVYKQYIGYEADSSGAYISNPSKLKPSMFTYDAVGRVVRTDYPDGTFTRAFFDDFETTVVDANGKQVRSTVDAYGWVVKKGAFTGTYPSVELYTTTIFEYDPLGRLVKTMDNVGNETTYTYDNLGRRLVMDDPDMGDWSYTYDKLSRLTSQTDAKNQTIVFTYDILSRLTKKTYPDGSYVQYDFDTFTGYTGTNSKGRLVRTLKSPDNTRSVLYYDAFGRQVKTEKTIEGVTYTNEVAYDDMGRVTVATYPEGSAVHYTYNAYNGAVAKVGSSTDPGAYLSSLVHNEYGLLAAKTFGNGVTLNYTYDEDNFRLTNARAVKGANTIQNLAYSYDDVGMVTGIVDHAQGYNWTYTYDDLYRLSNARRGYGTTLGGGAQIYDKPYAYDTIGNITSFEGKSYAYDDADHVHAVTFDGTNTYTYDANGNMLSGAGRAFTWDYSNKPTTIVKDGTTVDFSYGPDGERVKKAWGSNYKLYVGNGYEKNHIAGSDSEVVYITASGARIKKEGGNVTFFLSDHLGGMNVIVDGAGSVVSRQYYQPYGSDDTVGSSGSDVDAHKFTDQEQDVETGLYYYNARYYDPALGRFVSADPVQGLNRYAYVANNPVNLKDPNGTDVIIPCSDLVTDFPNAEYKLLMDLFSWFTPATAEDPIGIDPETETRVGLGWGKSFSKEDSCIGGCFISAGAYENEASAGYYVEAKITIGPYKVVSYEKRFGDFQRVSDTVFIDKRNIEYHDLRGIPDDTQYHITFYEKYRDPGRYEMRVSSPTLDTPFKLWCPGSIIYPKDGQRGPNLQILRYRDAKQYAFQSGHDEGKVEKYAGRDPSRTVFIWQGRHNRGHLAGVIFISGIEFKSESDYIEHGWLIGTDAVVVYNDTEFTDEELLDEAFPDFNP